MKKIIKKVRIIYTRPNTSYNYPVYYTFINE